jgi:DNA repair exonuclease SbcCD nuclease subunit
MSKKIPYLIVSDLHLHNWQAFSDIQQDGINSRLAGLMSELLRSAAELKKRGGARMYVAGDVFHVRGSIAPSVLNPVIETFKTIISTGIEVRMIAGNHDLEGKNSTKLGSAITALEGIGVSVCHESDVFEDDKVVMVPWYDKLDDLRKEIEGMVKYGEDREMYYDLIIHAPLNGVITGLPDHGLSTEEISKWGFKRVFAGHHHNHKDCGSGVYSIGALAHHTWSDVNSKAGFVIVDDDVHWMKSHLSEFVDIHAEMSESDAELAAEGNFVRVKVIDTKATTVESIRDWMLKSC